MNEQLATIKRVADTLIATRDKEIDRLRSENAELRAALQLIARQDCVADDIKTANDLRAIANKALEQSC